MLAVKTTKYGFPVLDRNDKMIMDLVNVMFGGFDREHTLVQICKEIEERYSVEFEQIDIELISK